MTLVEKNWVTSVSFISKYLSVITASLSEIFLKFLAMRKRLRNHLLSTLQEPKKEEEEELGIFQILDRLEAAADNLLSRSEIFFKYFLKKNVFL